MTGRLAALALTAAGIVLLAYAVATWLDHAFASVSIGGTR